MQKKNSGNSLSKLTEKDLKATFDSSDTDQSGYLSYDEIKMVYGMNNVSIADPSLQALFTMCESNKHGKMCFEEFKKLVNSSEKYGKKTKIESINSDKEKEGQGLSEEELKASFRKHDKHGSGYIEFSAFQNEYEKKGAKLNTQIDEYFKQSDKNKDGRISFEEYRTLINSW